MAPLHHTYPNLRYYGTSGGLRPANQLAWSLNALDGGRMPHVPRIHYHYYGPSDGIRNQDHLSNTRLA